MRVTPAACLLIVTTAALLLVGCAGDSASGVDPDPDAKPVTLSVEIDGKKSRVAELPWKARLTVAALMKTAAEKGDAFTFQATGSGQTFFVQAINGKKNERQGRSWILYVGGKKSDRGAGVTTLRPGDAVLWKFEEYQ